MRVIVPFGVSMKIHNFIRAVLIVVLCILPAATGCSRIDESNAQSIVITSADSLSADVESDDGRYVYSSLTDKEKEYYRIIRDAAQNFELTAVFPEAVEPEMLRKLFIAVYCQEEEIFWLNSIFFRPDEPSDTLQLTYRFNKSEAEQLRQELETKTEEIFSAFDESTTDYEKLKHFHDTLVLGCTFSQTRPYVNTTYGAIVDGYAQCEGYAFAFDYLCSRAGIDCLTVNSVASDGETHAWNVVKLDGMWYHVDCTWDDPLLETESPEFLRHYYFLVSDSDIIGVTHYPDNTYFTQPQCISTDNYYVREGLSADSSNDAAGVMIKAAQNALDRDIVNFGVRFTDKKAYDRAYKELFDGKQLSRVIEYVLSEGVTVEEKKYVRYCNEDELIIHVALYRK